MGVVVCTEEGRGQMDLWTEAAIVGTEGLCC